MSKDKSKKDKSKQKSASPEKLLAAAKGERTKAITKLNKLGNDDYLSDQEQYITRLNNESDRGVILLLASLLEDALETAVKFEIPALDKIDEKELFGFDAPFGSFSKKIIGATAFGIISPEVRGLIDHIRSLRNKAAHLQVDIDFDIDEIRQVVLTILDANGQAAEKKSDRKIIRCLFMISCTYLLKIIRLQREQDPDKRAKIDLFSQKISQTGGLPYDDIMKEVEIMEEAKAVSSQGEESI